MPYFKCVVAVFIPLHSGFKVGAAGCASKILRRPANKNQINHKRTQNFKFYHTFVTC